VNGENRTTLAILTIAVLSLILAGVFEPRMAAEANAQQQTQYVVEDVSGWLFRLASWLPSDTQPVPATKCFPNAAPGISSWSLR
jgi:hypothetical protein